MKKFWLSTLLLSSSYFYTPFHAPAQRSTGWKGIVPLRSTRADVERLLGPGEGKFQRIYRKPTEIVAVDYSEAPCKGPVNGWNVAIDTVLEVTTTPRAPKRFSEWGLDERSLIKTRDGDDGVTIYFNDLERGIRYAVQDSHVVSITYRPVRDDNGLRCAGFPAYDGGLTEYQPYASFPADSIERTSGHLDDLASQLANTSGFKAYLVSYAGKIAKPGEAKRRAEAARDYLINKRGIPASTVFAIDGGFREEAWFELYLVPNGMAAPSPKPTLTPAEITLSSKKKLHRRLPSRRRVSARKSDR